MTARFSPKPVRPATIPPEARKVLVRYLIRYSDRVTRCDLCGRDFGTESQGLHHFTKDELAEIAQIEKAKVEPRIGQEKGA